MSIWGIGGKLVLYTALFSAVIVPINSHFLPQWCFTWMPENVALVLGSVFVLIGGVILAMSIIPVTGAFRKGKLASTGIYSVVRNPLYSAWIVFILPGMAIMSRYFLWWLIPVFTYIVFKMLIKKEDTYLEERLGEEYRAYRSKVNELIPRIWPHRKNK